MPERPGWANKFKRGMRASQPPMFRRVNVWRPELTPRGDRLRQSQLNVFYMWDKAWGVQFHAWVGHASRMHKEHWVLKVIEWR
eukprot:2351424-Lingulodinium_polyedra.AAC.1